MNDPAEKLIDRLVDELERGKEPDLAQLAREFPGHADKLVGYLEAARLVLRQFPGSRMGSALPVGAQLGDFEVGQVLASGGMGTVYLARQQALDRPVALKVLGADLSPVQQRRFENEAKLLAPIHHAGLAEIYGYGQDTRGSYIAMELVQGIALSDVLRALAGEASKPSPDQVRRIVGWGLEVARALAAIHAERLVHRDVKPANIVIESDVPGGARGGDGWPLGRAVLVDFGLVRDLDTASMTRTHEAAMTWEYAPPEQIEGAAATPAMDTFSLGVALHDLLAGCLPEDRARAAGGLPPLALGGAVNRDLVGVINKATRPEVRWRYSDGSQLAGDLEAWLDGRPVAARKPPLVERMVRGVRRHPGRVLLGAAGAAAFLALAVGLAFVLEFGRMRASVIEAYASGDLRALDRGLRELPALPGVLPRALAADGERLQAGGTEPLAATVRAWVEGRDLEALRLAAAEVQRAGGAEEALLLRFLVANLQGIGQRATRDQADALRLACRAYHEREVRSPAEFDATADLRAALREVFENGALGEIDRYWAMTGLSGCGGISDAAWMLEQAGDPGLAPEQLRLVLFCARRILLRESEGGSSSVLAGMEEDLAPLIEQFGFLSPENCDDPDLLLLPAVSLDLGVLLADRAGGQSAFAAWLAAALGGSAAPRPAPRSQDWDYLLPDLDTHLSALWPGDVERTLEMEALPVKDTVSVAEWDFTLDAMRGEAGLPEFHASGIDVHKRFGRRLRFGRFGESRVELPFRIDSAYPGDLMLSLHHLAARRSYLLQGGAAHLVIELDGRVLVEIHEMDHIPTERHVRVFRRLLTQGEHRIVIRSGAGTSTTYWLYSVDLRLAD